MTGGGGVDIGMYSLYLRAGNQKDHERVNMREKRMKVGKEHVMFDRCVRSRVKLGRGERGEFSVQRCSFSTSSQRENKEILFPPSTMPSVQQLSSSISPLLGPTMFVLP